MDLIEYKAHELFAQVKMPASGGFTIDDVTELSNKSHSIIFPVMVKAQVPVGGRGKAGGVKPCHNEKELNAAAGDILGMDIKGHLVKKVFIAPMIDIQKEWYLSIVLDRVSKCPLIMFSTMGGMEIEEVAKTAPDKMLKVTMDPLIGPQKFTAEYLISKSGLDSSFTDPLYKLVAKLYQVFINNHCTLCEINPLAVTAQNELIAADAKIAVDDSALYMFPDLISLRDAQETNPLILESRKYGFLYIPCDPKGHLAVISNGSGMIMSCIDVLSGKDIHCNAALDLGGGATAKRIKEALRIVLSEEKTKGLFINIFGGITRCNEVALGIRLFMEEYSSSKLIVTRFEGTNKEEGIQILKEIGKENVLFADGLYEGVALISERRHLL